MGTIAIEIDAGRRFETLLETGEGKALSGSIKSVWTGREMAVWNIRPTVAIVAALKERVDVELFVSSIVID